MRTQDHIIPIAHVKVAGADYNIYISVCMLTQNVHIFKYNEERVACQYRVCESQEEACQFIAEPLIS